MEKKLVVANWKSHKTTEQSILFLQEFARDISNLNLSNKTVVICLPYHALSACSEFIKKNNLPIALGAQNISSYDEGAYTGELAATQIQEYIQYTIVGHSERRDYLHETPEDIQKKVDQAIKHSLVPIFCVQNENTPIADQALYIAYEPPTAIGSGKPDSPEHISDVLNKILAAHPGKKCMYGGSVSPQTILEFVSIPTVSGFLIGGASLEPSLFSELLSVW